MDPLETFITASRARLGSDAGAWIDALPELIEELTGRWELTLGDPYDGGSIGYTVPASRGDDARPVVLKITYPDGWFSQEAAALLHWDGSGAVELIDHDVRGALLMERAEPGQPLLEHKDEDEALEIAASVLERLWIPDPGGITPVAVEVLDWATTMPARLDDAGRPFERGLVHEAVAIIRELVPTQGERVLLHGDLHLGNILDAGDGRHVAVDPKPLVGERAFDVTALIRDTQEELVADPEAGRARVQHRFDLLTARLELDRKRVRDWSLAIMVDYALWDFEVGDEDLGATQAEVARMLRDIRI